MPLPRRSAEHGLAHVGRAAPARPARRRGCGPARRTPPGRRGARAELEGDVEDDVPAGVGLEPAGAVAEAAVGGGEGADAARARGPRPAREAMVWRPPGRRRRRSGSGSRRPSRGCRTSASTPTQPRSTARATRSSQSSPAATVTIDAAAGGSSSLDVGRDAAGRDLDDRAVEAVVGDHEVAAAAEHQHRLAGVVRGVDGLDQLGLGRRRAPSARGRAAEPQRGVVARAAASRQARTTALGMPSTFCPLAGHRRARPWSGRPRRSLTSPATSTSTPPSAGHDDRVGELAAELDHLGAAGTRSATARAASAIVYMPCAITPGSPTLRATCSSWWIGLWSPLALGVARPGRRG